MKNFYTDEVYVVNQPKHSLISIVMVDNLKEDPLRESIHERLFKLSEVSDLFIIFKDVEGIDPDKFAKLYTACAWIVKDMARTEVQTFLKALEYSVVVFNSHAGYLAFEAEKIKDVYEVDNEQLEEINASGLNWPIFKAQRLDADEMHRIYTINEERGFFRNIFGTDEERREYTTWKMTSSIAFFRPWLVPRFMDLNEDYINSFTWKDIKYFLASACEYLGIKRIEADIFSLDINKIRNDSER